jgi:hypothetical protein
LPSYYIGQFDIDLKAESFSLGLISLYSVDEVRAHFEISAGAQVYQHCNQDLRSYMGLSFPALPQYQPEGEEWMTDEQEEIVSLHGWSSLVVLGVIVLQLLVEVGFSIRRHFIGNYQPRGKDQGIPFSNVPTIAGYIPQVSSDVLAYPLLLVDTAGLDAHLFSWQDPDRPHSHYDITHDVDLVLGRGGFEDSFAKVMHWHKQEEPKMESAQPTVNENSQAATEEVVPNDVTADVAIEDEAFLAEKMSLIPEWYGPN